MKKLCFASIIFVLIVLFVSCNKDEDYGYIPDQNYGIPTQTQTQTDDIKDKGEKYDIIYELNGGEFEEKIPNEYFTSEGIQIDIKPVKEGYKFFGWIDKNSGQCVDKISVPKESCQNFVFYAIWYTDIDENGFILRNDGEAYSLVWYNGTKKDTVEIPESVGSLPVTKIDSYAFYFRSDITRVVLNKSVNEFGSYVFEKAKGMEIMLKNRKDLNSWLENLITDSTNEEAIEVIKYERPAIGFSKWL